MNKYNEKKFYRKYRMQTEVIENIAKSEGMNIDHLIYDLVEEALDYRVLEQPRCQV